MEYRNLGLSGLKVSELSYGSWLTFGESLDINGVRECMHLAVSQGVNFFDTAEVYARGAAELLMGEILREFRREDVVISTKIYFGGKGPNQTGLSYKHLVEGAKNSLRRLNLDYVDLFYCHRPDPSTPIEETIRAVKLLMDQGLAFYWGTSEWSRDEIEKAFSIAKQIGAAPPTMEQPQYNLFHRERVEKEYLPLYQTYGLGLTTFSPLDSGILTGRYNEGIPKGSRLDRNPEFRSYLTEDKLAKVKQLTAIANELNTSTAELAIAWCLKNKHVSSVILGASNRNQLEETLRAIELKEKLSEVVLSQVNAIFKA